ncbi:hypothetical protein F7725_001019 [Dissostichus mawsoni]|uniref:GH18 domain-containing protein n=1 Tax=Dissostichus mawsoni TaxID=36200 RepID=A0A7J5ZG24_DISMA|nr:hypothetical protein F7725_001019 [Dissostichus mawsoni]
MLCKELKDAFEYEGETANRDSLIISVSVSAEKATIDASYQIPQIAKHLDFINVLTFDFHGPWESVTGHHSPLYKGSQDTGNKTYSNTVSTGIHMYAAKKVILRDAFSLYFVILIHILGLCYAVLAGPGSTSTKAKLGTCLYLDGVTTEMIPDQKAPYATTENQWVGFDNKKALTLSYLKTNNFGGAFLWSLDLDDMNGQFCKMGNNPFLSHLHNLLTFTDVLHVSASSNLVCYYTSWSKHRAKEGKFSLSDVDPNLCTHLIYAFSGINDANELASSERDYAQSYSNTKKMNSTLQCKTQFVPLLPQKSLY